MTLSGPLLPEPKSQYRHGRVPPGCADIHQEFKRQSVTKQLLWEEYKQAHETGGICIPSIVAFTENGSPNKSGLCGKCTWQWNKVFVDHSGATVLIVNPAAG